MVPFRARQQPPCDWRVTTMACPEVLSSVRSQSYSTLTGWWLHHTFYPQLAATWSRGAPQNTTKKSQTTTTSHKEAQKSCHALSQTSLKQKETCQFVLHLTHNRTTASSCFFLLSLNLFYSVSPALIRAVDKSKQLCDSTLWCEIKEMRLWRRLGCRLSAMCLWDAMPK